MDVKIEAQGHGFVVTADDGEFKAHMDDRKSAEALAAAAKDMPAFPEDQPEYQGILGLLVLLQVAQSNRNQVAQWWWRGAVRKVGGRETPETVDWTPELEAAQEEVRVRLLPFMKPEKALQMIMEATGGACDGAGLVEAVALLISQRDNARKEAEEYAEELDELRRAT